MLGIYLTETDHKGCNTRHCQVCGIYSDGICSAGIVTAVPPIPSVVILVLSWAKANEESATASATSEDILIVFMAVLLIRFYRISDVADTYNTNIIRSQDSHRLASRRLKIIKPDID